MDQVMTGTSQHKNQLAYGSTMEAFQKVDQDVN